jgi:hypothetical protein
MPGGDRTGPAGAGPMTGRAAGYCAGYPAPGYMNPVGGRGLFGRGMGRGGGRGRGYRNSYYATGLPGWARYSYGYPPTPWAGPAYAAHPPVVTPQITAEQEVDGLKQEAEYLKTALDDINDRINRLESGAKK